MKSLLLAVVLSIAATASGPCEDHPWHGSILSDRPLPGIGKVRSLRFDAASSEAPGTFSMTAVTLRIDAVRAEVVDQPDHDGKTAPSIRKTVRDAHAFLGINGGYFDASFQPDGWCLIGGREITPAGTKKVLSGLFWIPRSGGAPRLEPFRGPPGQALDALQTGPFLIDPGGIPGIRAQDGPKARRTAIAQSRTHQIVLSTTEVSLYDLADCLASNPEIIEGEGETIERALNFDGGPSTGIFLSLGPVLLDEPERWPVRNIVVFRTK